MLAAKLHLRAIVGYFPKPRYDPAIETADRVCIVLDVADAAENNAFNLSRESGTVGGHRNDLH